MDGGGILFYRSGEVLPGIEEACDSGVVFCEELDDCLQTDDSWGELIA